MAIDAVETVFREIPAASAIPQLSLTRTDRELLKEEGRPPLEVTSAVQEAMCWQKNEDPRKKWKKRQEERAAGRKPKPGESVEDDEPRLSQPESTQKSLQSLEQEGTGTLFNDRM